MKESKEYSRKQFEKELTMFMRVMKIENIDYHRFHNQVIHLLNRLSQFKEKGKRDCFIDASNKLIKNACKFIIYYYQIKCEQSFKYKKFYFTCCQYRLNQHKLEGVFKHPAPRICHCVQKPLIEHPLIKKSKKVKYSRDIQCYEYTAECVSFHFYFY